MTRHRTVAGIVAEPPATDRLRSCLCCAGVISDFPDRADAVGLDLELGLVSDECALICNDCTAKLIEARASQGTAPRRLK
jgi:hypothetical protein